LRQNDVAEPVVLSKVASNRHLEENREKSIVRAAQLLMIGSGHRVAAAY